MNRKYLVWCDDNMEIEDDALLVDGYDFREAAKEWARQMAPGFGVNLSLSVRSVHTGEVQRWSVGGELVPIYFAWRSGTQEGT